jgi:hypothetical protein
MIYRPTPLERSTQSYQAWPNGSTAARLASLASQYLPTPHSDLLLLLLRKWHIVAAHCMVFGCVVAAHNRCVRVLDAHSAPRNCGVRLLLRVGSAS